MEFSLFEFLQNWFSSRISSELVRQINHSLIFLSYLQKQERAWVRGQSLKDIDAFPNYLISMISAGEETGSLITVFDKISNHLDMQLENSLERLNKLIEPIIIVFVGIVVSIIAFAILSPILSLNEFV